MAETMKDYEKELNESMKKIEEGDILTGTVVSVDEKEVILDLKYYAEGVIPAFASLNLVKCPVIFPHEIHPVSPTRIH